VLLTVEDTENRATLKLARAVEEVKKLLVPVVRKFRLSDSFRWLDSLDKGDNRRVGKSRREPDLESRDFPSLSLIVSGISLV
jgi:hypothetical protein